MLLALALKKENVNKINNFIDRYEKYEKLENKMNKSQIYRVMLINFHEDFLVFWIISTIILSSISCYNVKFTTKAYLSYIELC